MRILLIGKNGQLGWELHRSLAPLGELIAVDYPEVDLADVDSTRCLVRNTTPDLIVNSAAYTAVDKAEIETDLCRAVNSTAPGALAEEAKVIKAALIHFSTDYVFDGTNTSPYVESDLPNPLNTYGKTKLEGEQAVQNAAGAALILRTSWVYSTRQGGFVNKVLQWSRQQSSMRVVVDQVASPTWCRMLAEITAQVAAMGAYDIFAFIDGFTTWQAMGAPAAGNGQGPSWIWTRIKNNRLSLNLIKP